MCRRRAAASSVLAGGRQIHSTQDSRRALSDAHTHADTQAGSMRSLVIAFALLAVAYGQEGLQFVCPESYGDFADEEYCDYFWRCTDGEVESMECQDGHSFNPALRGSIYPCDDTYKVNCTGRELLRDPLPVVDQECERQYGTYPDYELCDTYYICQAGVAIRQQCPSTSHFDIATRECVWPEIANRGACDKKESLGDFTCPPEALTALDANGNRDINPTYLKEDDCRYFYVCLNGVKPTLGGCPEGTVYNDVTAKCDDPANVVGCENYYSADGADYTDSA